MTAKKLRGLLALLWMVSTCVAAAPLAKSDLPAALKDWLPWAMQGQAGLLCPPSYNGEGDKTCVWPARLELRAGAAGASFKLTVEVFGQAAMVALPGEAGMWPQDVRDGGRALAVAESEGRPATLLEPGRHLLEGLIPWQEMPQDLLLPRGLGLTLMWVDGAAVGRKADADGRIWLRPSAQAAQAADALELHTSRLIDDQVPLQVTSHFQLAVAGRARQIELPLALLPGMLAVGLDSALPVRLQDNGSLLVQARPGTWTIQLSGRLMTPTASLSLPTGGATAEEVWLFAAHNDLRLVNVEGPPSVDPKLVLMPESWRQYPAYLMKPGDSLKLIEARRGNATPQPDNLTLQREIWLDFDGRGYTIHDEIAGGFTRSARLNMAAPGVLGRASVDGQDQPITRLAEQDAGLEIRDQQAKLSADSRVEAGVEGPWRRLPASGWAHDFSQASARLHLPPGWRLLHVGGVDLAGGSWVAAWTLWDFFFVLLSALAAGRLIGWKSGLLLGVALTLSWHMDGAPRFSWLLLLGLLALLKVLTPGRLATLAQRAQQACALALALLLMPYAVNQVRLALYPTLEQPWRSMGAALPETPVIVEHARPPEEFARADLQASKTSPLYPKKDAVKLSAQDPAARVQTGPGLPRWQWSWHPLNWQGPLQQGQEINLFLLPPAGTVVLRLASLGLMVAALLSLLGRLPAWPRRRSGLGAVLLVGALTLLGGTDDAQAADPAAPPSSAPALLDEMRAKLTAPPDCMPRCAEVARLTVLAKGGQVQLRMEVHALAAVSLPLPGDGSNWLPSAVSVDGRPATTLRRAADGALWIALAAGVSQVSLEAALAPGVSQVDIALPMPVRQIQAQTEGWTLAGLDARGLAGGALSLSREQANRGQTEDRSSDRDSLPPFVRVERTLHLGLRWTVETRVSRVGASRAPLRVQVALLAGESVNDAAVQVSADGLATLQLGAEAEAGFSSTLKQAPQLRLSSTQLPHQIEVWRLDASSQWHVAHSGLAPVAHQQDGRWLTSWQPWPGERLELAISKPAGVGGQTFTLDSVRTQVTPGAHASDFSSTVALRSSLGGNHRLQLPPEAELLEARLDGEPLQLQAQAGALLLPVTPGAHELKLSWREPRAMGWWFQTSALQLGASGVNDYLQLNVPDDRVVLALGGPSMGPAVLIWGALLVMAALALGLARGGHMPLSAGAWFLLGAGVAPLSLAGYALVLGWFLALAGRQRFAASLGRRAFMLTQVVLLLWTLAVAAVLLATLREGLLGYPNLLIQGNGSNAHQLLWYSDRLQAASTAQAWVVSVPLLAFRVAMLLWALWLAASLLGWVKWAWGAVSAGGLWPAALVKQTPQAAEAAGK